MLPKIFKYLQLKSIEPIPVHLFDNRPTAGRHTDKSEAVAFVKEYGLKVAENFVPNPGALFSDYESMYMSKNEMKKRGFQGVISATLMGLSSLHIFDNFLFDHPIFGKELIAGT